MAKNVRYRYETLDLLSVVQYYPIFWTTQNKIAKILETARKRIFDFIENQGIKPSNFLQKTGLKKGFIDKSHIDSGATDILLSNILDAYPEINAEWLLTGRGPMLKKDINNNDLEIERLRSENAMLKELLKAKEELLENYRSQAANSARKKAS
jgi:hypothetical protein